MRVCYHVESHRGPEQVERLVRRLRRASRDPLVVVSHDASGPPLPSSLTDDPSVWLRLDTGGYADFSHVRRWLATVAQLEAEGVDADWVVNLSGQCYPLRPVDDIEHDLATADVDGFLQSFEVFGPDTRWPARIARNRYLYKHRRLAPPGHRFTSAARAAQVASHVQPWLRVTTTTGTTVGTRRRLPSFVQDHGLRGGSFFCALRRDVASSLLRTAQTRPDLVDWFETVITPAEVFFQTVLGASDSVVLSRDNRRYIDFRGTTGNRPRTLGPDDLPVALASGKDFGRKFQDDLTPGLLDDLDDVLDAARGGSPDRETERAE